MTAATKHDLLLLALQAQCAFLEDQTLDAIITVRVEGSTLPVDLQALDLSHQMSRACERQYVDRKIAVRQSGARYGRPVNDIATGRMVRYRDS